MPTNLKNNKQKAGLPLKTDLLIIYTLNTSLITELTFTTESKDTIDKTTDINTPE